jgi:translation initiation factor IF-2
MAVAAATAGVRIIDLAKELGMAPAELVTQLKDLGIEIRGISAVVDLETAQTVRDVFAAAAPTDKIVEVMEGATLKEVAEAMGLSAGDAVKKLMGLGELVAPNQRIKAATAEKLAKAYGHTLRFKQEPKAAAVQPRHKAPAGTAQLRPPVVTIMGHVDHGKTTLLDSIRKANVVEGEFGGITQHIGAYQVEVDHAGEGGVIEKRKITFLDTPGHEAFTSMRARGASVTDIVILVVAADDGIMPQTVEAINHAKSAKVPMIVAINKMDKPDATPDRVKQQLTEHNLVVEEYGGDVIAVPLSAKTGEGIPDLLEYILLVADVEELKADPSGHAHGVIVEAKVLPGRGPVATILVQSGTLRVGENIVAGMTFGKVRAMTNDRGERILKAPPSTPVEVIGLNAAPAAGDQVEAVPNEKDARQSAVKLQTKTRNARLATMGRKVTLADLGAMDEEVKDLNVIVKGDVQGSVEAVVDQLNKLAETQTEVRLQVKMSGVGTIGQADVEFAVATDSVILGFNVKADPSAQQAAERSGVDVRFYNVIYALVEDMDRVLKSKLKPIYEEAYLGRAEVRQVFRTPRGVVIAGSYIQDGKLQRNAQIRVIRGKNTLYEGRLSSLRHIKDERAELAAGFECGVVVDGWTDFKEGDTLECFEMREVPRY